MKVFISWSGKLSKKVAQELKKWLPCIIQSIDVFYSSEDIEKGENWDSKISSELSECNYGIVCLTSENTIAPWINFEAGAIAKTLDSRVSALMVDIKTSDIQGPLKRYQATKLEKEDIWQLISEINKATDNPLDGNVLESTFNAIWDSMYAAIKKDIDEYVPSKKVNNSEDKLKNTEAVEEILQLLRKQNVLLSSPEQLLPPEYFYNIQRWNRKNGENDMYLMELFRYAERMIDAIYEIYRVDKEENYRAILCELHIVDFIEFILHMIMDKEHFDSRFGKRLVMLREKCYEIRFYIEQC